MSIQSQSPMNSTIYRAKAAIATFAWTKLDLKKNNMSFLVIFCPHSLLLHPLILFGTVDGLPFFDLNRLPSEDESSVEDQQVVTNALLCSPSSTLETPSIAPAQSINVWKHVSGQVAPFGTSATTSLSSNHVWRPEPAISPTPVPSHGSSTNYKAQVSTDLSLAISQMVPNPCQGFVDHDDVSAHVLNGRVNNIQEWGVTQPTSKKARLNLIRPDTSSLNGFQYSTRNRITIALVKECYSRFEERIGSDVYHSTTFPDLVIHQNSRFAMVNGHHGKVFRVIYKYGDVVQPIPVLKVHHKKLITYTYELHQSVLSRLNLSPPIQRLQHFNLLKWLEGEIFEPTDQTYLPVMGVVPEKYSEWKHIPDEKVGETQLKLIEYFCERFTERGQHELTSNTAKFLVETWQDQHEGKEFIGLARRIGDSTHQYLASSARPSTDIQKDFLKSAQTHKFQKAVSALASLITDNSEIEEVISIPLRPTNPSDKLINTYCSLFGQTWSKASLNTNAVRSVHPRIKVAAYFIEKSPIFPQSNKLPSCQLNKLSKNLDQTMQIRLENIYKWILDSILEPKNSLPIIGPVPAKGTIAPWEDFSNEGVELFGPVQLKLIEYFGYPFIINENIKMTAAFILTTCCRDIYPSLFNSLIEG
ncbi:hypothetical protein PSHT_02870 [Puccinia striiformis]|uniref:Uncharacterized protein n=1 Tax=Puccinia striiformis TaxID=27350 RepID=A0A2S4WGW9_9BASI|nr:hypothetical protein PSHT_02870 [Puccinia striiformis]